jgi:iron-sulfur cluster insertion protein
MSLQYLSGARIDFVDDLMGTRFVVNNPNAATTCGCGSSFAI